MVSDIGDSAVELKNIADKLITLEDLQNLTQLDMLNMKNEVEKLKLTSSSPISPEAEERLAKLQDISRDVDVFRRWKQTIEEVKFLRERLMGPTPMPAMPATDADSISEIQKSIEDLRADFMARIKAPRPPAATDPAELEDMRQSIEEMRTEIRSKKPAPVDLDGIRSAIAENREAVENLKHSIVRKPGGPMPDMEPLKKMMSENRKLIGDLKAMMESSQPKAPTGMHKELDGLHAEIMKLEDEMKKIKTARPPEKPARAKPGDEMERLRSELFGKLDELNVKFMPKGSEEMKKAMDASRASIDKLKSLVVGEVTDIGSLKNEMNENRKFMAEIKNVLLSDKPQKGRKIVVPPDPEIKNRMQRIEQKFESLSAKMGKISDLKPIKLPDFPPVMPPLPPKGARALEFAKPAEIEGIKKQVESIVSKMESYVTKDELEKGFLDKRLKTDEKLMTGDIYKEMNEIKKAILRNEDHITVVATDVERMKKEVGSVEKSEWGKDKEVPVIQDLKRKIDELEEKIDNMHEGPVFIE
jgi:hypothetical protein